MTDCKRGTCPCTCRTYCMDRHVKAEDFNPHYFNDIDFYVVDRKTGYLQRVEAPRDV